MLANVSRFQPKAIRPCLAPGSESRRGSQKTRELPCVSRARWPIILAVLLFTSLPGFSGSLGERRSSPEFIYSFSCFSLVLNSEPIVASDEFLTSVPEATTPREQQVSILPDRRPRIGAGHRPPQVDWTGRWMFLLGLMLFWVSWLLAVWERRPREYVQPLFMDEPAPAPRPPGIVFALEQSQRSKAL